MQIYDDEAEAADQLDAIFSRAPFGVCKVSMDSHYLVVNQRYAGLFGYTTEGMKGKKWTELTHPEDLERDEGLAAQVAIGSLDNYALTKRLRHSDGHYVKHVIYVLAVKNRTTGDFRYFLVFCLPVLTPTNPIFISLVGWIMSSAVRVRLIVGVVVLVASIKYDASLTAFFESSLGKVILSIFGVVR